MYLQNTHYVYAYLREDGTPYYIGKGKGARYRQKHTVKIPPIDRIQFIKTNLTDNEAINLEIELIEKYGRKDLGTGILRNQTPGGQGSVPGPEVRKKLSEIKKGKKPNNYGKKRKTISTPEEFVNRSKAKTGISHPMYNKKHSKESRKKISLGIKESWKRTILTCPHCGKQGKQNMTRWHFSNCKSRT